MKRDLAVFLALALLSPTVVVADRPAPQREYTVSSTNGRYEFTMYPTGQPTPSSAPHGDAFRVNPDGTREFLWKVEQWFSPQTFLADDGRSLVRMGPWAALPASAELAVAFYRDGREVRRYVVADLIDDTSSLVRSVSHYMWQSNLSGYPLLRSDGKFLVQTVEGRVLAFDVLTGELCGDQSGPTSPKKASRQSTREDADELYFASNLCPRTVRQTTEEGSENR